MPEDLAAFTESFNVGAFFYQESRAGSARLIDEVLEISNSS